VADTPNQPPTEEKPKTIDYLAIATKFLDEEIGESCVYWNEHYWKYTGQYYERLGSKDDLKLDIANWQGRGFRGCSNTRHSADEIEFQCRAFLRVGRQQAMPGYLGESVPTPRIVSMSNGLLDLNPCTTGESPRLLPHNPKWFSTSALPFSYDSMAKCPQWLKFLDECLEGDTQRINLLQEWYGYCCVHDTSYEKALLMEGTGANGKSQAIVVLERLVGKNNCSSVSLERIGNRFQDYGMLGKLVNFSTETPANCHVHIAALRQLITGDTYQFEPKNIQPFDAKPTARFVISMNARPKFFDPTNALWRRLMLMPWNYTVPEEKRTLDLGNKIADAELPGIFLWAIEGLKRLWANGRFTESTVVKAAVESLRNDADPERAALLALFESDPKGFVTSGEAFELYQQYCNDAEPPLERGTPATLASAMKRVFPGVAPTKKRLLGSQVRGWEGIKRKTKP